METAAKIKYPIVFVTGIGQTWTSLKGSDKYRWNLFPRNREIIFDNLPAKEKYRIISAVSGIFRFLALGGRQPEQIKIQSALESILRHCRVNDDGSFNDQTDIHIYGTRSFEQLGSTDFYTGEPTNITERTLLDRLLRDIPCRDFVGEYGNENMYCFNYSPFSDLYSAADELHKTLGGILKSRQEDKVILVPMSMGAAVTLAYIDAYFDENGAKAENYIHHVVSVVGAWDGSEGFADLLEGRVNKDWDKLFFDDIIASSSMPGFAKSILLKNHGRTNTVIRQLLDALLDGILLRSSSFPALVPSGRWEDMYGYLFSEKRMERNSRLKYVREQTDRFIKAQKNLRKLMKSMHENCGIRFSFTGGTGLRPGEESRDFDFMKLLRCSDRCDTDGVLQQSSAFPFDMKNPESFVSAYTVFDKQMHEIGNNPEAMRIIFDLISEKENDPPHFVPKNQGGVIDDSAE